MIETPGPAAAARHAAGSDAGDPFDCPYNPPAMRRWLLVFLLFVAPLQLAWGAAAQYCGHETQACSKPHPGHHEHRHQAGADDGAGASGALAHADCASCHLACSVMPALASPAGHAPLRGAEPPGARLAFESHIPIGPERRDRSETAAAVRSGVGVAFGPHIA